MDFLESKKGMLISGAVAVILLIVLAILPSIKGIGTINSTADKIDQLLPQASDVMKDYIKSFRGEQPTVVFIWSPNCSWCVKFEPIMNEVINEYNLNIISLDIDQFTQTDYALLALTDAQFKKIGTPEVAIVSNNKVQAINNGYVEKQALVDFFKSNQIIK